MLLTVFADRLLCSDHLIDLCSHASGCALAVQFLDYPLILLRSQKALDSGTVEFRSGKAAAVDADEQEVAFLTSHVQTTISLLDTSIELQPKILATGRVVLQNVSPQQDGARHQHIVKRQNIILCDAAQQPVACVELYASLQPEGNMEALVEQLKTNNAATPTAEWSCPPTVSVRCAPGQQVHAQLDGTQKPELLTRQPQQQRGLHQLSSAHASSSWEQSSIAYNNSTVLRPCSITNMQQQPFGDELQKLQQKSDSHAIVLEHKQVLDSNLRQAAFGPNSTCNPSRPFSGKAGQSQMVHNGEGSIQVSPGKLKRDAVSKSTVQAAALRASQILSGNRPAATAGSKPAAVEQIKGQLSQDPDVWSPLPPRSNRHLSHAAPVVNSISRQKTPSPQKAGRRQRLQGLKQLKQQQAQHWHSSVKQQALGSHQQQPPRCDEEASDDCLELDDISCSLSAVLEDEKYGNALQTCSYGPRGTMTGPGNNRASTDSDIVAQLVAADAGLQLMVQPVMPADWQLQQPQPQHQQQPHMGTGAADQHAYHQQQQPQPTLSSNGNVPAAPTCSGCQNCAATLSAAAQLLQASQQAAAAAAAGCAQPITTGGSNLQHAAASSRPAQQMFQGGVSAAAAVMWELMTLMSLRAVMSQAVNSMAGQLSNVVNQALQQALGGISQLAGNAAMTPGCAAAMWPWAMAAQAADAADAAAGGGDRASSGHVITHRVGTAAKGDDNLQPAVPVAEEQQLTPKQLQEQQEELHRQFEQLEALMVVRDDISSSGSSSSGRHSSAHSNADSRHRRQHRHRSFRANSTSSMELRHSSSSPVAHDTNRLLYRSGSLSARSSGQWSGDGREAAAAAAASTSGMIVRLRRTMSDRRDRPASPLSRATSAAGDRLQLFESGVGMGTAAAAAAAGGSSQWVTLEVDAPAASSANPATHTAAATKRSSVPVTLPPLSRPTTADSKRQAAAGPAAVISRRKMDLAAVDTSYSDNYEEDFESPVSSKPASPSQAAAQHTTGFTSNSQAGGTEAAAAAAALDLLHKALPAVTVLSPGHSPRGLGKQGLTGSTAGINTSSTMWQRNSLKLDRRGSELPEIPEISEGLDGVCSLEEDLKGLAFSNADSPAETAQQHLQKDVSGVNGLPLGAAAPGAHSRGSTRYQVTDTLDTLTESIMEDMVPPAAKPLSRRGSSIVQSMSTSGLQDWPVSTAAARQEAGPRSMSAALPGKGRRPVLAPIAASGHPAAAREAASVSAAAKSPGSSLGSPSSGRWHQHQQQLDGVSSFVSVDSTMDDLLASSDLAMPRTASKPFEAAVPDHGTAAATNTSATTLLQQQQDVRVARAASAARRVSNYSDVSFLSDEEEEVAAAAMKHQRQQQQQQGCQVRRTESGISYMSSFNGSEVDIDYSAGDESAYQPSSRVTSAVAVGSSSSANPDITSKTVAKVRPQPGPAISSSKRTAAETAEGSQKGAGGRSAADVFYSHVSGTPTWPAGTATGTRMW